MPSPIATEYKVDSVIVKDDLTRLLTIIGERGDMQVHQDQSAEGEQPVTVTLHLPEHAPLDGLTVFQAVRRDGRWWETSSDSRFMP